MIDKIANTIYFAKTMLAGDYLPLYLPMVKGKDYSAFVDSGTKPMFPQLVEMMHAAGVKDADMRFVIQTHSHADHIGNNVALKQRTGCLVAGHKMYAHWHTDVEAHYQGWARTVPELMPDTPELRASVWDWFDSPHHIDLFIDEGTIFDLGGGVTLEAFMLQGHMKNDIAWLEGSTRTLIGGDCITATEWPHFHIHETVPGYRKTLSKFRKLVQERNIERVFFTHFGPMPVGEALVMVDKSQVYLDKIDRCLLKVVATKQSVTLEEVWKNVAAMVGKTADHYSLTSIYAHVVDFMERGLIKEVGPREYSLR